MKIIPVKPLKPFGLMVLALALYLTSYGQFSEVKKLQQQLPVTKDSVSYVNLLNRIGFLIHLKSADSCFYYGIKAQSIAVRLNYTKGKADALSNIAAALMLKGLYSQSLFYYSKTLAGYRKIADTGNIAQTLMNSAIVYSFTPDSNKTIQFGQRAIRLTEKLHADSIVSMLYVNYVNLNTALPADSVNYYLHKAYLIAHKYKDERTLMFMQQVKADKLLDKGKYKQALPLINQSLVTARANKWEYHEMESLNLYARYYLLNNNIDSAISRYQVIYNMAIKNEYAYWLSDVLKSLLHCYELKHDEKQQIATNKLLVTALEKENINENSFIGDYITYNNTQEDLVKMGILNNLNDKKITWLLFLSTVGIIITILMFLLYSRSRVTAKNLSALHKKVSEQNISLQQTDDFKGKLISMLAHDFRSPLSSAISMVRLLKDHDTDLKKEELSNLFDHIETDMQNILLTFDNILLWVKKQLSGYVYNPQNLNVYELMKEASSLFNANAEAKSVTFQNDISQTLYIQTDKEIIQFINRNLIHNALKYSPVGGIVNLNAFIINNEIIVSITDQGNGISEKKLKDLFSFSSPVITDGVEQGAGVALTICKEFIQKIHGRIWAESKKNEGSVFFYALPVQG